MTQQSENSFWKESTVEWMNMAGRENTLKVIQRSIAIYENRADWCREEI